MSGKCRSLATAVFGVLFGSVVQQAGFDLDPTVFAPMEDAIADLIVMSTSSSNGLLTLPSPTSGYGPSITPTFLQNRLPNNIDLGSIFLMFLIACHVIAGIYAYFLRTRASKTAAMVTQRRNTNNAKAHLIHDFANFALYHVWLWGQIYQLITHLQAAVRRDQQKHHNIINRLHHQYQGLLRQAEAKAFEVMTEMWQLMQQDDRRIKELVNAAHQRSSELVSVKGELQAAYEDKQSVQGKLSDCEQQMGQVQDELSNQKNDKTIMRDRLDEQTQQNQKLEDNLIIETQARSKISEELKQNTKYLGVITESHKDEKSKLGLQLQAEREAKAQLQSKVKELDEREAQRRHELDILKNQHGSLQSEKEKILAEKAALEREKAKLAEENAMLQMENRQYVKTNEELQNDNATLAQVHQRSEPAEQGNAASQPLPANQDQTKDSKLTAPTGIDNEKLPSTNPSPRNTTESSAGAKNGSIDPTGEISPINAGSSSQGRLFGRLPPPRSVANHDTDDDPKTPSVVPNGTNDTALPGEGQSTGSSQRSRGTFTFTQDVPSTCGGPLDWDHPPSPVTNRESDWGLNVGSHRPSTSANRKEKPSQGLYVPVHRRPITEATPAPKSEAAIPPSQSSVSASNI